MIIVSATAATAVYGIVLWIVGAFSSEEMAVAKEGLAFVKPLIKKWSKTPQNTLT